MEQGSGLPYAGGGSHPRRADRAPGPV